MKVITIVGARPQFIKASVVSQAMKRHGVEEILVHTGQHYDHGMSQALFDEMTLPTPKYHLNIGSSTHGKQTGSMMCALEDILIKEKPNWVLVYGDTNSTLAGAITSSKLNIPLAHVEAGLRSYNKNMPEELNRILTDHASDLLFTPTDLATKTLLGEGIPHAAIVQAGDVMLDATLHYSSFAINKYKDFLKTIGVRPKEYILATIHRAENTDDRQKLSTIMDALKELSKNFPIVLPLHPRTEKALQKAAISFQKEERLHIIPPVTYLQMLLLEKEARVIVTDSGGVQKEAFFCKTPCITLRSETEWTELLSLGWNTLCPVETVSKIVSTLKGLWDSKPDTANNPYGEGKASHTIVQTLINHPKSAYYL